MYRKSILTVVLAGAFALVPSAALALDCVNVSRPPAACGTNCNGPVTHGNWVWLPSLFPGAPEAWGFAPPGTIPGNPGENGNFQNGQGSALLVNAFCDSNGAVLDNRQTDHGIQLDHGCE